MNERSITNLRSHIRELARTAKEQDALISTDEEGLPIACFSYAELDTNIDRAAVYLSSLGLQGGDRVALAFGNSAELLIISWAAWASGIITVPLDVKRDTQELCAYKIQTTGAKLLIVQQGALKGDAVFSVRIHEFRGLPQHGSYQPSWIEGIEHDALILFTSGTTGNPKGALLTLRNLIVNAEGIIEWLRIQQDDRFLVQLPLHHINSTTFCLSMLLAGGAIAIPPQYSNSRFWKQAAETGATLTSIVQSILFDQLGRTEEYRRVKERIALRRIQIGSAPVIAHSALEFESKFGVPLQQGYGQTETALRATGVPMDLSPELHKKMVEENSIGAPMQWADVEIANENGGLLCEGEEGELVIRGSAIMKGYIGGEHAFRNGYFLSGDIGYFKLLGGRRFFYLKGRKKEIIIKGGINISPAAVENHLKKVSQDIDQVYVVPVPDARYGEEVGAAICWRRGIDTGSALRRLKFRLLSGTLDLSAYETPKYIATITASDLPMTSTGKVQRSVLKERLPLSRYSSLYEIYRNDAHSFVVLSSHSPYVKTSAELYNRCWQPLTLSEETYRDNLGKQFVLLALDSDGEIAGQIAFIRTNRTADELLKTAASELLTKDIAQRDGKNLVCISICSAVFRANESPTVSVIPAKEEVEQYLTEHGDPVLAFHQKPKGGLSSGAELIGVIPNGRPEDKSSCGYTMLLAYPEPKKTKGISEDAPVSNQLIEAVLVLARDAGLEGVYAYSRPGGLSHHIGSTV